MEFDFSTMLYWHWWILAVVLAAAEMFVPGSVLIAMGVVAALIGCVVFFIPGMEVAIQLAMFAILSIGSVWIAKRFFKRQPIESDHPTLNKRATQYIGRTFTLQTDIENGTGKAKVEDMIWNVRCDEDLPKGSKIKVIDADGVTLVVERTDR